MSKNIKDSEFLKCIFIDFLSHVFDFTLFPLDIWLGFQPYCLLNVQFLNGLKTTQKRELFKTKFRLCSERQIVD